MKSIENDRTLAPRSQNPFDTETPLYVKEKEPGDILVTVVVPDFYHIALPNLGHQMVEYQWNQIPGFIADRAYLSHDFSLLKEHPGSKPEILCISMSYEGSYIRALRMLDLLDIPIKRQERKTIDPLIIIGGWSVSRNPLPVFDIADVIGVGDSEQIIAKIAKSYQRHRSSRNDFFDDLIKAHGIIIPSRYTVRTENGYLTHWEASNAPTEIFPNKSRQFPYSHYLSPETDYNHIGYYEGKTFFSIEIVDACASKCLFCASGFREKTRDIWDSQIIADLATRGTNSGADLVKLFFPANSSLETTKEIMKLLLQRGLSPRVGSAKAERIDREYIDLIGRSGQEKIAFAPETGDYELRRDLGKPGMTNEVLKNVIATSIDAGISNLDLYLIMNLPGEATDSFQKSIDLLGSFYHLATQNGLRGVVRVSAPNSFPKAWTPFQYARSGNMEVYESKIAELTRAFEGTIKISNMAGSVDLLSQNVISRGGAEVGNLLVEVYRRLKQQERSTSTFTPDSIDDWRFALMTLGLEEQTYFEQKSIKKQLPWYHIHLNKTIKNETLAKAWEIFQVKRGLL
jgi:radical SAM superfamily enzyme YgiQ (UPF0313 family)